MRIIEYDTEGRPINVVSAWPPGYIEMLERQGKPFVMADDSVEAFEMMVQDGELVERPECPGTVIVEGRTVSLEGLPDDTGIVVVFHGLEPIETTHTQIEFEEPGPVQLVITPPWPFMEATYDLDLE